MSNKLQTRRTRQLEMAALALAIAVLAIGILGAIQPIQQAHAMKKRVMVYYIDKDGNMHCGVEDGEQGMSYSIPCTAG